MKEDDLEQRSEEFLPNACSEKHNDEITDRKQVNTVKYSIFVTALLWDPCGRIFHYTFDSNSLHRAKSVVLLLQELFCNFYLYRCGALLLKNTINISRYC